MPLAERCRRARPILRRMRLELVSGRQTKLLGALFAAELADRLDVELARHELAKALVPGLGLAEVELYGDPNLVLWLVDRALKRCSPHKVHRGGYRVTSGPVRQTEAA